MHKTYLLWPLCAFQRRQTSLTIEIVLLLCYFKESRQNSTVEEDSEGDNDSEEFYYGGQVSSPCPSNTHSQQLAVAMYVRWNSVFVI